MKESLVTNDSRELGPQFEQFCAKISCKTPLSLPYKGQKQFARSLRFLETLLHRLDRVNSRILQSLGEAGWTLLM